MNKFSGEYFKFPKNLKNISLACVLIGFLGILYGFLSTPSTVDEALAMVHNESHSTHSDIVDGGHQESVVMSHGVGDHIENHDEHNEHLLHNLQNKPWASLYVSAFFFMMLSLGTLAFYAIQRVSQAGWSPLLFRVMEGITAYLFPGLIFVFIILLLSGLHFNHLFIWMDEDIVAQDPILQDKSGYLNVPFFLIRAVFYSAGWILYRHYSRKFSIAQDTAEDNRYFKKNFKISAAFLVFYLVTESMMSWDWIMSVDPHWFSTLFGWYVFAGMFVSGITTIALITIFLKSIGYLKLVNDSHIHDLAKYMFGISIFWTYLWFSQFMLIWYSNIPEEVTYFMSRFENYKLPFLGMLVLNFLFPFLVLMNSDYKRINVFVVGTGIVLLFGHYIDVYNMIMPSTVGEYWFIGISEISSILFFMGLFVYVVFNAMSKAFLVPKRNPFIKESEYFHY